MPPLDTSSQTQPPGLRTVFSRVKEPLGAGKAAEAQPLQSGSQRDKQWVAELDGSASLEGTWGAVVLAALARWELRGPASA